ncbi:MAG: sensor domain-containing phosphodiesterase [Devosia sp.]
MSPEQAHIDLTQLSDGSAESIQRVLGSIRSYLGMDVAFVSEFSGRHKIFRNVDGPKAPIAAGQVVSVEEGYCQHVVEGRLPELIPDTQDVPAAQDIPETASIPIGAHLSVPIRLRSGRVFGTFCSFSYEPHPELDARDLDLMRTFAQLVARQIEHEIERHELRLEKSDRISAAVAAGDPRIVFQPICRLDDGVITGVEALSRFDYEPRRSPDQWFGDAADVGLDEMLELTAIRQGIRAASTLPPHMTLNVNASPRVIASGGLPDAVAGIDPHRLIIEVTEHSIIEDYHRLIDAIAPLRAQGIRVAIDDAGAGYASLRHVLMLRPDVIKFDISITRGVDTDPMRLAMAAALAEFGRHTGTAIVAEGVETMSELQVLRSLGIERGQGYYFSRPVEPSELVDRPLPPRH